MTDHPITPPPELVRQWSQNRGYSCADELWDYLATQAAQWGADQELEACCEWLHWQNLATHADLIPSLRAARRPKPPSLKERALQAWASVEAGTDDQTAMAVIRRALEALPE